MLNHLFTNGKTKISAACHEPDSTNSRFVEVEIPFSDSASIENATHCWALLLHFGLDDETIAARMARLEPVAMRLELKEGVNGCTIINDSYNSDLTSLGIALNFLEQQGKKLHRTLVLSDILQSGQSVAQLYGTVAGLLIEKRIDRLIGIGKKVEHVKKYLPRGFDAQFYPSTQAFLDHYQELIFQPSDAKFPAAANLEPDG